MDFVSEAGSSPRMNSPDIPPSANHPVGVEPDEVAVPGVVVEMATTRYETGRSISDRLDSMGASSNIPHKPRESKMARIAEYDFIYHERWQVISILIVALYHAFNIGLYCQDSLPVRQIEPGNSTEIT